jgi:hypothetical protein
MVKPLVLVIVLVTSLNRASAADTSIADALQCSNSELERYALSSADPAEKVAEAAFEKCSDRWREVAEAWGRDQEGNPQLKVARENCLKKLDSDCPPTLPSSVYYLDAARRTFVHDSVVKVFDIRAKAARR